MHDVRDDEQFILSRGMAPLRCGRAIYFRRPEMQARVAANRFHNSGAPSGPNQSLNQQGA